MLKNFENHLASYYLSWLFLPFSILWVFSVNVRLDYLIYIFLISMLGSLAIHYYWITKSIKSVQEGYMLDLEKETFSPAGIISFLFSGFAISLFLGYLFFAFESILSYLAGLIIVAFFIGGFVSSKNIHGKVIFSDSFFLVLGILAVLIKFLVW